MDKNRNIENKINESFNSLNNKAPENIWDNISDSLDVPVNETVDNKIKDSFENAESKAPEHAWNNINKQLNIDNVWTRVSRALTLDRYFFWFKRFGIGLSAVALLFFVANYFNTNNDNISELLPINNRSEIDNTREVYSENVVTPYTSKIENTVKEEKILNKLNEEVIVSDYTTPVTPESNISENNNIEENTPEIIIDEPIKAEDPAYTISENYSALATDSSETTDVNLIEEDIEKITPKPAVLIAYSDDKNDFEEPEDYFSDEKPKSKPYFFVGLISSYNRTSLMNSNLRQSKDGSSLILSNPTYGANYGVMAGYGISPKSSILTEFYFKNGYKQSISGYEEGRFYTSRTELNYMTLTLLYERKIPNLLFATNSNFVVKAGGYYSSLRSNSEYLNDKLQTTRSDYENDDYGVRLLFGQQKDIRKFIIDYGLNSSYGLKNTYKGNELIPGKFNKTNNFYVGLYLNLRFRI